MEMCRFLGCLPSELYKKHNPTLGDYVAIAAYYQIKEEEEAEKIRSMMGRG